MFTTWSFKFAQQTHYIWYFSFGVNIFDLSDYGISFSQFLLVDTENSELFIHRWVWVNEVAQSCPTLRDPVDCSHQAPLSMGFSRQGYWSGLPFPSPGIFLTQGSNPDLPQCRQTLYHQGRLQVLFTGRQCISVSWYLLNLLRKKRRDIIF